VCEFRFGAAADIYYQQRFSMAVLEPLLIMDISSGFKIIADKLGLSAAAHLHRFRNRN
jgi:hypothetical protein